ncbi:MAG: glycosyltransferase family 4 protein [Burkholderiaceae bacterium]
MKVTVAMLGARRHYAVPRLLHEAGLLDRFFTDSYIGNKPWLETMLRSIPPRLSPRGVQRWLGRKDAVLPREKVWSSEALGLWFVWARMRARTHSEKQVAFREAARRFSSQILRAGLGHAPIVWGFNGAALELFQAARAQNRMCVLEQTILPAELEFRLMREELGRWPGWQPELDIPKDDPLTIERARREWELADCIVAGSDFVRGGLEECGVPATKIRVVPYGVDVERFSPAETRESKPNEALRVLFVGQVGLRKGVPDLLHALAKLGRDRVQAKLAGRVALAREQMAPFSDVATFLGAVPRIQMSPLYRWADLFVLPSIVEGSAAASYEALLSGLPVIATPNTGSIIEDGVNGRIVPIRDAEALADAIGQYAADRDFLARHQATCRGDRASAGLTRYRSDLMSLVDSLVAREVANEEKPAKHFR